LTIINNEKKAKGYYLDRTGRTIKYIKAKSDDDEVIKTEDPNIKKEVDGTYTIENSILVKCDGENRCDKIDDIRDNDFYVNYEEKYTNEFYNIIQCMEVNPNNSEPEHYNKYIKCSLENKTNGFFTNTQRELINCHTNDCSLMEGKEFENIANIIPKYYINGNVENDSEYPIIICTYTDEINNGCEAGKPFRNECIVDCPQYQIQFNNLFVNSGKAMSLISCTVDIEGELNDQEITYECKLIDATDFSYYITSDSETVIEGNKGSLIECTVVSKGENSCVEFVKETLGLSYYINSINNNKIIKCDNTGCISEKGYNYFIDGCSVKGESSPSENLNCYNDNTESFSELINCSSGTCMKIMGSNRDVYIKGNGIGLITCNAESCEEIDDTDIKDKTLINGSNEKYTKPIIVFNHKTEKWEAQTAISNMLYLNGNNGIEGRYSFIYCSSISSCSEVSGDPTKKYVNILSASMYIYNNIYERFESGNNMIEILERSIKGFIVNAKTMEVLEDNTQSGILVVCTDDDKNGPTCSTNGSYTYYISGINPTNIIKNNYNDPIFVNSPVQGYYINYSNNVIACDGSRCYIYNDYEECNINKIGSININLELCGKYEPNSGIEIKIDGTLNGKFMVEISRGMFPDNLEGSYLLKFSNNVITPIFNDDGVITYYLISDSLTLVSEINMKGTLYKCQGSEACVIESSEGSYPNSDINTVNKFTNISCNKINGKLECEPGVNKKTENEVYCLSKQENSYLYICTDNCSHVDDNNTPCRKEIANVGYYIPYYDNQLIECSDFNKCNNDTSIKSVYYKSGILNQPLIHCTDLLNKKLCSYTQANNGFYLTNISDYLLKCNDGICSLKDISDQYNNDESYVGYYMSGKVDGGLISCKKSKNTIMCSLISTPKEGWYVNGDPDKMETGNILIKCQSLSSSKYQISCSESRSLNEGYVINVASENKLINCITGELEDINDGYYYVNGENEKLMYCIKNNDIYGGLYECNNVSLDNNRSWFKINSYNPSSEIDDDKKIIICTKYKVCSYYTVDQMKKGYYLNSDVLSKNKSYPLIYNDGVRFIVKIAISRIFNGIKLLKMATISLMKEDIL